MRKFDSCQTILERGGLPALLIKGKVGIKVGRKILAHLNKKHKVGLPCDTVANPNIILVSWKLSLGEVELSVRMTITLMKTPIPRKMINNKIESKSG